MTNNQFPVAVVAMQAAHDKESNLSKMRQFVCDAAAAGARLLVFPEGALQGFLFRVNHQFDPVEATYHWENAEPVPGPSTQVIAEWAAEHDMVIVAGMMEKVEHPGVPVLYNSAVVITPSGIAGTYRKVHQPSEEMLAYRPGREWPVFNTTIGRIGAMICYDQCFPEAARELTLRGAEILVLPNAWAWLEFGSDERYDFFARARAAENARWLLQANQVGQSSCGDHVYIGRSRIIAPSGIVVAEVAPGEEGLAVAEVEPVTYDPTRKRANWYLQQRRPETYTTIADPDLPGG